MFCFNNLYNYIVCKYTNNGEYKEIESTKINDLPLGWSKRYKKWIYYFTEKYYFSIIQSQLHFSIKVYDKNYKLLSYNWDFKDKKYQFTNWYTHFYKLTDTNPILKMFNLDHKDLLASHGYCDQKEFYFSVTNKRNDFFHLMLSYGADFNLKKIVYITKENRRIILNYDKMLTSFNIENRKYIKV